MKKKAKRVPGTAYMRSKAKHLINMDNPKLTPDEVDQIIWQQTNQIKTWNCQFDILVIGNTITLDHRPKNYPEIMFRTCHFTSMKGKSFIYQGSYN